MSVKVTDNGADALLARMSRLNKSPMVSDVGVIGDAAGAPHGDGETTTGDVALFHELGLGNPRRSWLIDTINQHEELIAQTLSEYDKRIVAGTLDEKTALDRFGLMLVGLIQERIAAGIDPPNAESTVALKGSSTPLIDTGQFRSSITNRTTKK